MICIVLDETFARLVAAKGTYAAMMTISNDRALSPTTLKAETLKAKNFPVIGLPVSTEVSLYRRLSKFVCSNTGRNVPVLFTYNLYFRIFEPPLKPTVVPVD